MTITVPITALGLVRATEVIQTVRNDLAQRHDRTTRTVSVEIGERANTAATGYAGQNRVIDLQV